VCPLSIRGFHLFNNGLGLEMEWSHVETGINILMSNRSCLNGKYVFRVDNAQNDVWKSNKTLLLYERAYECTVISLFLINKGPCYSKPVCSMYILIKIKLIIIYNFIQRQRIFLPTISKVQSHHLQSIVPTYEQD